MIEQLIPIVFKQLLHPRIFTHDIEDYDQLNQPDVIALMFDDVSDENAHQLFKGFAGHIHDSSHRDTFYYTKITCNFLHLAIQLQRLDIVHQLLHEHHVNPLLALEYTQGKDEEHYDSYPADVEHSSDSYAITPLALAHSTGSSEIITLLNAAITLSSSASAQDEIHQGATGYEADAEDEAEEIPMTKPIHYKRRLILGDGNLSYSRALVKKRVASGQSDFSEAFTVTEYNPERRLRDIYSAQETDFSFKNFEKNVAFLREMSAEVTFGVDATRLEDQYHERRFKRIHFNFPYYHDDALSATRNKEKTRELVGRFFESASKIQLPGDRIHMGLVTGFRDPVWYEHATYGVAEFCEAHGYAYVAKRHFIDPAKGARYPGYFHAKTSSGQTVDTAATGREFVFEKKIPGKEYEYSSQKKRTSRHAEHHVLRAKDTDSDTSSYEEDSESSMVKSH